MANDKKFLVKNGLTTQNISFVDDTQTTVNTITVSMLGTDTLSFSANSGQLFSITDSMTGTIFAVNDISGVPSIEVDDTGIIRLAETFGNVLIGTATDNTTDKLQINGSVLTTSLKISGYGAVINSSGQWVGPNSGLVGYTGSQGTAGAIGYTGSQGTAGAIGYTGSQGTAGAIGYTGSQGTAGAIGYTGSQGTQGVIGYTGSQGTAGAIGYTGSQGTAGAIGYTGSQGDIGYTGSQGDIGYTGSASTVAGYTGSQGIIGYTGSAGTGGGGGSAYNTTIGDGSATSFTITHSLATSNIFVSIREVSTGYFVYPDVKYTSTNDIVIEFNIIPTTDQYYVAVLGA